MRVNGKKEKCMGMEFIVGKMDRCIKGIIYKEKKKDTVFLFLLREKSMMGNGKKELNKD